MNKMFHRRITFLAALLPEKVAMGDKPFFNNVLRGPKNHDRS